jgi:hypothetical protein
VSAFIEQHRERFGVEPICQTLGVSASAYYERASGRRSARAIEDERLLARIEELQREGEDMTSARANVKGSNRMQKDRSAVPAVLLRSPVPGTAGNRREQPTTSHRVCADFPACSRLCSDNEPIGETGFEPATARPPAGFIWVS